MKLRPAEVPTSPIGRGYVCQKLIGTGGMGEVFQTADPVSGRIVALKLIRADRAQRARALRRFTREVRAMARLEHPGIVAVYDYGVHVDPDGVRRPFFVMEHVSGESFRTFLERDPSLEDALPIFDLILAALAYAHARGVVHRDLKPENVLLVEDLQGVRPKILDFGIARVLDDDALPEAEIARMELELAESGELFERAIIDDLATVEVAVVADTFLGAAPSRPAATSARASDDDESEGGDSLDEHLPPSALVRLTQLNQCVGTPAYLAPEQIRPRRYGVGPTADLYAVGIMLFELLCGHRPFRARTPRELLRMHLVSPIPEVLPRADLQVPEALAALVRRLLSKHAHQRPPFAADVRRALRAIMRGREVVPPLVPGLDANPPQDVEPLPRKAIPAHSAPGSSQLGERDPSDRRVTPASFGLGLLNFREPPVVGRVAEQHQLWAQFIAAHETGRMHLVLIDGEAGIGKSRLVRWLFERAEEQGLAHSFVAPYAAGPGGGGLRVALERFLQCKGLDGEHLQNRIQETLRRLGLTEPWMLTAFTRFLQPQTGDGGTVVQAPSMLTAYALVDTMLGRLAADRPVLFSLDDIHWAAEETIDLLHYLLDNQTTSPYPALVVATVRSEELLTDDFLRPQLELLATRPEVTALTLTPLAREDLARLIGTLLPLDPNVVATVAERAAGHPMFAIQLLGQWVAGNELEPGVDGRTLLRTAEQPVPTRINEVVDRRVAGFLRAFGSSDAIPAHAVQSVLEWMAIVGEPLEFGLLCELAKADGIAIEHVDRVWESALVDGLCVEDAVDTSLRFSHQIIADQLLDWARSEPSYPTRQSQCAEAKLRLGGRDPVQLHHAVSKHLFEAAQPTKAWRHLVFSARCSLDRNQDRVARQRLRHALDALEQRAPLWGSGSSLGDEHHLEVEPNERFDARRAYIEASLRLNLLDDVARELDRLRPDTRSDHARLAWAALLDAELKSRRGKVEEAANGYLYALQHFGDAEVDDGRTKALRGLGTTYARAGHLRAGLDALEQAEPLARRSGDENLLADVLMSRGVIFFDSGQHAHSERNLAAALELFTRNSNLIGVGETHLQLGRTYLIRGRLDEAEQHFEAARTTHSLIGDRHGVIQVLNSLGEVARARRDLERAETAYTQALELTEARGVDEDEAVIRTNLGLVQFERGHFSRAAESLSEAAESFRALGIRPFEAVVCGLLACATAELGDFAACALWVRRLEHMDLDRAPADRDFAFAVKRAAELAAAVPHPELAAPLLVQAADAFRLLDEPAEQAAVETLLLQVGALLP